MVTFHSIRLSGSSMLQALRPRLIAVQGERGRKSRSSSQDELIQCRLQDSLNDTRQQCSVFLSYFHTRLRRLRTLDGRALSVQRYSSGQCLELDFQQSNVVVQFCALNPVKTQWRRDRRDCYWCYRWLSHTARLSALATATAETKTNNGGVNSKTCRGTKVGRRFGSKEMGGSGRIEPQLRQSVYRSAKKSRDATDAGA